MPKVTYIGPGSSAKDNDYPKRTKSSVRVRVRREEKYGPEDMDDGYNGDGTGRAPGAHPTGGPHPTTHHQEQQQHGNQPNNRLEQLEHDALVGAGGAVLGALAEHILDRRKDKQKKDSHHGHDKKHEHDHHHHHHHQQQQQHDHPNLNNDASIKSGLEPFYAGYGMGMYGYGVGAYAPPYGMGPPQQLPLPPQPSPFRPGIYAQTGPLPLPANPPPDFASNLPYGPSPVPLFDQRPFYDINRAFPAYMSGAPGFQPLGDRPVPHPGIPVHALGPPGPFPEAYNPYNYYNTRGGPLPPDGFAGHPDPYATSPGAGGAVPAFDPTVSFLTRRAQGVETEPGSMGWLPRISPNVGRILQTPELRSRDLGGDLDMQGPPIEDSVAYPQGPPPPRPPSEYISRASYSEPFGSPVDGPLPPRSPAHLMAPY